MAPRSLPSYNPLDVPSTIPSWFTNSPEFDLYGEIAKLNNADAIAKDRELAAQRAQAQLDANQALSDPTQSDPYAEASAILEKAGMLDQASQYKNRNAQENLSAVDEANKLSDAGFEQLAKDVLTKQGLDSNSYRPKQAKTDIKEIDPEKDIYQVKDGQLTLIRPGQKKTKEYAPDYKVVFNLNGDTQVVNSKDPQSLAKAVADGFAFDSPMDAFNAQLLKKPDQPSQNATPISAAGVRVLGEIRRK